MLRGCSATSGEAVWGLLRERHARSSLAVLLSVALDSPAASPAQTTPHACTAAMFGRLGGAPGFGAAPPPPAGAGAPGLALLRPAPLPAPACSAQCLACESDKQLVTGMEPGGCPPAGGGKAPTRSYAALQAPAKASPPVLLLFALAAATMEHYMGQVRMPAATRVAPGGGPRCARLSSAAIPSLPSLPLPPAPFPSTASQPPRTAVQHTNCPLPRSWRARRRSWRGCASSGPHSPVRRSRLGSSERPPRSWPRPPRSEPPSEP